MPENDLPQTTDKIQLSRDTVRNSSGAGHGRVEGIGLPEGVNTR